MAAVAGQPERRRRLEHAEPRALGALGELRAERRVRGRAEPREQHARAAPPPGARGVRERELRLGSRDGGAARKDRLNHGE